MHRNPDVGIAKLRRSVRMVALILALNMVAFQAGATTLSDADVNAYYTKCINKPGRAESARSANEAMCACTAAGLKTTMSAEEMAALANDKAPSATQDAIRRKIVFDVQAPCLMLPVTDLTRFECAQNPQLRTAPPGSVLKLCDCAAQLTGSWFGLSARGLIGDVIRETGATDDLPRAVLGSTAYRREYVKNLQACMTE